ncbi:MAG: MotA/TolQ/ExbB proton channel family protein [Candidatus Babeliales bacterium]
METSMFGNVLWQLIAQSDYMTKLVLLILLVMSITCWAVVLYKVVLYRIKKRDMQKMQSRLKEVKTFEDLRIVSGQFADTVPGYFLAQNISFLKSILETKKEGQVLTERDLAHIQDHLDQTLDEMIGIEQSMLPILFASASISPLLGLFGTVWGLVHAFVSISQKQTADIVTVAPGIAEALITTLVGLIVAIPALAAYHYLQSHVHEAEQQYVRLADKYFWLVNVVFGNK